MSFSRIGESPTAGAGTRTERPPLGGSTLTAPSESMSTPENTAPSESESRPVEARQPEEQNPPLTVAGASSSMEGAVGTDNRANVGQSPDDYDGDTRSGQNPPNEQSQRPGDGGAVPTSAMSQAAFKSGALPTEGLAGQVEAAIEDETPNTAPATTVAPGQAADVDPAEVKVPDVLAKTTGQIVSDAYDGTELD